MKASQQDFNLSVVLTFKSLDEILMCDHSMVLFIMCLLYKVGLTFESADEVLKWNHSNERFSAVLESVCF